MIGHLRGQLAEKRPNQVLVDVGGVGYQVVDSAFDVLRAGRAARRTSRC